MHTSVCSADLSAGVWFSVKKSKDKFPSRGEWMFFVVFFKYNTFFYDKRSLDVQRRKNRCPIQVTRQALRWDQWYDWLAWFQYIVMGSMVSSATAHFPVCQNTKVQKLKVKDRLKLVEITKIHIYDILRGLGMSPYYHITNIWILVILIAKNMVTLV